MAYSKYIIRPIEHGLNIDAPSLSQPFQYAGWESKNFELYKRSFKKRAGYAKVRDLGSDVDVQRVIYHQTRDGITSTIFLTNTDAIKYESGGTWSYINKMHTGGTSAEVATGTEDTVDGTGTDWVDATDMTAPAAGDYFILDDDLDSDAEPQGWAKIESVDSDTQLTLVDNYMGTLDAAGDYYIRNVYSVPANERWSWAILNSNLYFSNGNEYVQVWTGSGTATDLDTTYAKKARYLIEYADRLIMADYEDTDDNRQPFSIFWSKNGDPSNWSDSTAGEADLLDTEFYIMGLGKVGANLVIYKTDSLVFAYRTGESTSPIAFGSEKVGVGCAAPYGIVSVMGTNVFIGRNDFYAIYGDSVTPIGKPIKDKFFELVNPTELKRVFGYHNALKEEVRWLATDDDGNRRAFIWNYKTNEWSHSRYNDVMSCGGRGEI